MGEVLDGIGELANMILGNFKESIETQTGPLALTVPTVVYGKKLSHPDSGSGELDHCAL